MVASGGGWTQVSLGETIIAYIRFTLNDDHKTFRIAEVRVTDPDPDSLRRIPLARIETAANANGIVMLGLAIAHKKKAPADVTEHFRQARVELHAMDDAGRWLLRRPKGRRLDDVFYRDVARAYTEAAGQGLNPRQTLAVDTGSAPDTVARWVGEARRRGYLPPTTPGKVTAAGTPKEEG